MSNTAEETKPVPRAERIAEGSDTWIITYPEEGETFAYDAAKNVVSREIGSLPGHGHLLSLIREAKLREELELTRVDEIHEVLTNGNRVAAALGLPEGAGVDEVLAVIRSFRPEDDSAGYTVIHTPYLREIKSAATSCQDALHQLDLLGQFIGHPGATPAHVVSETVSWIERLKGSDKRAADFRQKLREITGVSPTLSVDAIWREVESLKKRALAAEAQLMGGPDESPHFRNRMQKLRQQLGVDPGLSDAGALLVAVNTIEKLRQGPDEANGWHEKVAEQLTEIKELTKFRKIVCHAHGIPSSANNEDVYAGISEYLEKAEGWRLGLLGQMTAEAQENGEYDSPQPPKRYSSVQEMLDANAPEAGKAFREMKEGELSNLRRFHHIVCRMHGVTYQGNIMEDLHQIAEKDNSHDLF